MLGLAVTVPINFDDKVSYYAGDQTGFGWILNEDSSYTGFSFYWNNTDRVASTTSSWLCDSTSTNGTS